MKKISKVIIRGKTITNFVVLNLTFEAMDEEMSNSARRMSMRTRKIAPKMAAALASSDNRTQVFSSNFFLLFF